MKKQDKSSAEMEARIAHIEDHLEARSGVRFFRWKYREPADTDMVVNHLVTLQRPKLEAIVPDLLDTYIDQVEWEYPGQLWTAIASILDEQWAGNPKEFKNLWVKRTDLLEATGLSSKTLKRNTDHLVYRGDIQKSGGHGGHARYVSFSLPTALIHSLIGTEMGVELKKREIRDPKKK